MRFQKLGGAVDENYLRKIKVLEVIAKKLMELLNI